MPGYWVGSDGRGALVYGGGSWQPQAALLKRLAPRPPFPHERRGPANTAGTLGAQSARKRDPCSSATHRSERIVFHLVSPSFTYFHLFFTSRGEHFHLAQEHSKTNGFWRFHLWFHLRMFTHHVHLLSPPRFGGFGFFAASSCNPLVVVQVCLTNDSRHNLFQRVHGFGHCRDELLVFLGEIRLREHFPKLLRRVYQDLAVRVR